MDITIDNVNYKFIPQAFDEVNKGKQILENDVFEKYEATALVRGEYLICRDPSKLKQKSKNIVKETYEEYLEVLKQRNPKKDQWIYNVIDGISEQDMVLYQDDLFVLLPSYIYDSKSVDKVHLLAIPKDKSLRTIRELNESHVPLLKHMKEKSLLSMELKYGLKKENLKMFFHYDPSTYHLHLHLVNLKHDFGSSVEYSHDLDLVIFNLSICSDYYKIVELNKRS
jgi:m7GpppX diphosphatase